MVGATQGHGGFCPQSPAFPNSAQLTTLKNDDLEMEWETDELVCQRWSSEKLSLMVSKQGMLNSNST